MQQRGEAHSVRKPGPCVTQVSWIWFLALDRASSRFHRNDIERKEKNSQRRHGDVSVFGERKFYLGRKFVIVRKQLYLSAIYVDIAHYICLKY